MLTRGLYTSGTPGQWRVCHPGRKTAPDAGRVPHGPGVPKVTAYQSIAKTTITRCQTEPFELKY